MIRLANKRAAKSNYKHKLGSVIVSGGRVIATGFNEIGRNTHLLEQSWEGSIHAEEAAVLQAIKRSGLAALSGAVIYISRIKSSGKTGLAKPCKHCQELLRSVGIRKAIYTTDNSTETQEMRF